MRTLEKVSGTIAKEPRLAAVPVVLSDFETIGVTTPRAQDELKVIQAHFMTLAQCAARGITSSAERDRMAKTLHERMARYGASSEHIARRQVSVLTSRFVEQDPDNEYEPIRRFG